MGYDRPHRFSQVLRHDAAHGFVDTITIVLVHIVTTILGAIVSAFLVYLLFAYGIPALLFLSPPML